jgi:signal recognition particle GTPase
MPFSGLWRRVVLEDEEEEEEEEKEDEDDEEEEEEEKEKSKKKRMKKKKRRRRKKKKKRNPPLLPLLLPLLLPTRTTRSHNPENGILNSHRREYLKSCINFVFCFRFIQAAYSSHRNIMYEYFIILNLLDELLDVQSAGLLNIESHEP